MRQIINVVMVTSVMMFVACGNGKQAVQEVRETILPELGNDGTGN